MKALDRATAGWRAAHGTEPDLIVRAPGRVNLIGEHTDYNDGFVLPMALPHEIVIAGTTRGDRLVDATSEGFEPIEFGIDDAADADDWSAYLRGMAQVLRSEGHEVAGWSAAIASDIPAGASLSSSAALEVAAGLALIAASGGDIEPAALARAGQRVENEVLGLPSGIMDQLASAASVAGAASLIDCRSLGLTPVPVPDGVDVVIMDTGTRRELVESQYADRRAACERAAALLGVSALRDAEASQIAALDDALLRRRAHHVVAENQRTLDAAESMRSGDVERLGRLMSESHASLRDLYEVSGPALDAIVELAEHDGACLGARMTGGGFAGCAVALVASDATAAFVESIEKTYDAPAAQPATEPVRLYVARPCAGASIITRPAA